MGLLFSRIQEALQSFYGIQAQILLLGLDGAGKTTFLHRLTWNETIHTRPTIGFNVERTKPINSITFTVRDHRGYGRTRAMWKDWYSNTDGLMFMVDSTDSDRFEEARSELDAVLDPNALHEAPLMLLANKQDLPGAWPPMEVAEKMGLRKLPGHRWHVQGCSAVSGEGIPEAMVKLAEMVSTEHSRALNHIGRLDAWPHGGR